MIEKRIPKNLTKVSLSVNELYHLNKILNNKFCTYYLRTKIKNQLLKKLNNAD
jgi:hypothetical protein